MKISLAIVIAAGLFSSACTQEEIANSNFSGDNPFQGWNGVKCAELLTDGPDGLNCMKFVTTPEALAANKKEMKMMRMTLPSDKIQGRTVIIGCQMKGENISNPNITYLGPKVMLVYKLDGKYSYLDMPKKYGTFDWTPSTFSVDVPNGISEAFLSVGLQACSGTFYIANIVIKAR